MELLLDLEHGEGGLADRLYRQLSAAILGGRLRPGEPLPPSRELAAQLRVSRATVTLVYERLIAEGHCTARVGAGTFVSEDARRVPDGSRPSVWGRATGQVASATIARPAYDFRVGVPDAALFPSAAWRRQLTHELDAHLARGAHYGDAAGHTLLREGIAHHIGVARSVSAAPDDVVVTAGAIQAIDLLARVLLRPGDAVAVEEPGYPPVRQVFEAHGARVITMPVDEEGADPSALPPKTRLVYVTPSHQFPLGVVMSRSRRLTLLEWAARNRALVIEDDYDSEHRFHDRPLEPLHVLDADGVVAYVGTFSKSLVPALRIGYAIPPAGLVPALRRARELADGGGDPVAQGALGRLIASGEFAAHMRRARRTYRGRHRMLTEALGDDEHLRMIPSSAGLHVCAEVPSLPSGSARRIRDAAAVTGLALEVLDAYCAERPREGLVLGFGAIPAEHIPDGVRALRSVLRRVS
ncbi:MAG: PLP-dependent aminotransferase family protein [Schumannella sp.]